MRVSVFGLGYVGSVLCGCLAEAGHEVVGLHDPRLDMDRSVPALQSIQ